jgi:hypothetical protein
VVAVNIYLVVAGLWRYLSRLQCCPLTTVEIENPYVCDIVSQIRSGKIRMFSGQSFQCQAALTTGDKKYLCSFSVFSCSRPRPAGALCVYDVTTASPS